MLNLEAEFGWEIFEGKEEGEEKYGTLVEPTYYHSLLILFSSSKLNLVCRAASGRYGYQSSNNFVVSEIMNICYM